MKVATPSSGSLASLGRLDSHYFTSEGAVAAERLSSAKARGIDVCVLGDIADVYAPQRFRRVYAGEDEPSVPYLRPYDILDYIPRAADHLSVSRSLKLDKYSVAEGTILQTCSGRNLGPAVVADAHIARFHLSHDLVRIRIADEEVRLLVLAYLQSTTGQELLRRDKSGSVIDHISVLHVAEQSVPILEGKDRAFVVDAMSKATQDIQSARLYLADALSDYESRLPTTHRDGPMRSGWTRPVSQLGERLDAAANDPHIDTLRKELLGIGGVRVSDVADVRKPPGRYKTRYVTSDFGRPILSGGQLLQIHPVNLRFMAPIAFKDQTAYELSEGWIVYQADGRAEEGLGSPALVSPDRDGWLASGHVGRVIPKKPEDAGWLSLALRSQQAQMQLKSLSSGSVVDSTYEADMASVVLPPRLDTDGPEITRAWARFAYGLAYEASARERVESVLT